MVIGFLTYLGKIGFDIGITISILSLFVPNLISHFLEPKVALEIKNLQFVKKSFDHVEGHQLKALITNNGKKICLNLDATIIQVKDAQGRSPNLLHVGVDETGGQKKIWSREEPMRDVGYAWIDQKEDITQGVLKELRGKDNVDLLFPYKTMFAGVTRDTGLSFEYEGRRSSSYSSECWLKLETNTEYQVVVEVKGEDSEKISYSARKTAKIGLPH